MNHFAHPQHHKPFPIIRYTLIAAFVFVIGPAIALAAKADKVEGFDRSFVVGAAETLPGGFSAEDKADIAKYLKATKKKKGGDDYSVGYALPDDVGYRLLPKKVASKIDDTPVGFKAVRVGNQVLLISEMSRKIIDRVAL